MRVIGGTLRNSNGENEGDGDADQDAARRNRAAIFADQPAIRN